MQAKAHAAQARALTAGLPEALRGQAAVMTVTSGAGTPEGVQVAHTPEAAFACIRPSASVVTCTSWSLL